MRVGPQLLPTPVHAAVVWRGEPIQIDLFGLWSVVFNYSICNATRKQRSHVAAAMDPHVALQLRQYGMVQYCLPVEFCDGSNLSSTNAPV